MFAILRRRILQDVSKIVFINSTKNTFTNIARPHQVLPLSSVIIQHNQYIVRRKSKKSQKKPSQPELSETETGEESAFADEIIDKQTKIMEISVKSMRIDGVLKAGLGIARNKIETLFYESKIRVNGQKLLKKSELAQEGDEIDIVKGANVNNPNFLTVARLEIIGIKEKGENLLVKVRRSKSLTIENYGDTSVEKS